MSERSDFEPDAQMPGSLAAFMEMVQEHDEAVSDDDAPPEDVPEVEEDLTEFEGDIGAELVGVINLGNMQKEFLIFGHRFVIRTLKVGEELAVAKIVDEWAQTIGQGRSHATGIVAGSVVTVDGHVPARGLTADAEENIQSRFNYILERWEWEVVAECYAAYQELTNRKQEVYRFLRSKSSASRTTSAP